MSMRFRICRIENGLINIFVHILINIFRSHQPVFFEDGDFLCREGEIADCAYVVTLCVCVQNAAISLMFSCRDPVALRVQALYHSHLFLLSLFFLPPYPLDI
jgi:hypothetical protein